MASFQFDSLLFQRGHTWPELLEIWDRRRDWFLEAGRRTVPLPNLEGVLDRAQTPFKVVVYYADWSLESLRSLSILGETLWEHKSLEIRYHGVGYFLLKLYPQWKRRVPLFHILDGQGNVVGTWGPRPSSLNQQVEEWSALPPDQFDRKYMELDQKQLANLLDQDLAAFFEAHLGS